MPFDPQNPETYPRVGDVVRSLPNYVPLVFHGFIEGQKDPLVSKLGEHPFHVNLTHLSFYPRIGDEVVVRLGALRSIGDIRVKEIREKYGDDRARDKEERLEKIYNSDWIHGRFLVKSFNQPDKFLVSPERGDDCVFPADALEVVSYRYPPPAPESG